MHCEDHPERKHIENYEGLGHLHCQKGKACGAQIHGFETNHASYARRDHSETGSTHQNQIPEEETGSELWQKKIPEPREIEARMDRNERGA
jgi:hypothetical protein